MHQFFDESNHHFVILGDELLVASNLGVDTQRERCDHRLAGVERRGAHAGGRAGHAEHAVVRGPERRELRLRRPVLREPRLRRRLNFYSFLKKNNFGNF